jgi:hypothetical protein
VVIRALESTYIAIALVVAAGCAAPEMHEREREGEDEGDDGEGEGEGNGEGNGEGDGVDATATLDGQTVVWLTIDAAVTAVSHDVGATFSFQADATETHPGVFGTVAFDADGAPLPCRDQNLTSNLEVRFLQPGRFFGAPFFGTDEATCAIEVLVRPRCPGDTLSLRFSGLLFGVAEAEGEVMSVTAGELRAATDFMLHGEPVPDSCP